MVLLRYASGGRWEKRLALGKVRADRKIGITHTIPDRRDHSERRGRRGEDPPDFDAAFYRKRNVVERCKGRLKQCIAIAPRYEKRAANYRAVVVMAALVIWVVP